MTGVQTCALPISEGIQGKVHSVSVLRQYVRALVEINDEKEMRDYKAEELKFRPRKKKVKYSDEEFRQLKALEDKGGQSSFDEE